MLEVNIHNAHCILGIEKNATKTVIKKAFRKKALSCHPDKNPDDPKAASEIFVQLCQAQAILLEKLIVIPSQNNTTTASHNTNNDNTNESNSNVPPENFTTNPSDSSDEYQVCPMCNTLFPKSDVTLEEFVTHVNSHFEETTSTSDYSSSEPTTRTFNKNAQKQNQQQEDHLDEDDILTSAPMDFGSDRDGGKGRNMYSQFYGSQRTRRWYSNYRSHTGIWKTSRITSNNQNWKSARSDNTKYHSSIDVDLEDVPFQPNKCDRIMASIILSSIVGGFLFCLIYGYVMFVNDHNDGKINKRHFFKRQDY